MWDVSKLLNYIKSLNLEELSLSDIYCIVATLLAINKEIKRVTDLASFLRKSVMFTPTEATLELSLQRKTQLRGHLQTLRLM